MAGGEASGNGTRVSPQGGILEGANPSVYSASNPVNTLIIQIGIIIIFCRLLHFPLSKMRQPRVIAEMLGGILLGPSVMGRIPGFTAAIFPAASMPALNATSNVGIILFLFLVGVEADFRYVKHNWRVALSVGAVGMVLPFGLGAALAIGLDKNFNHEPGIVPVSFGLFVLFVGIAMAITAFPVLCRILTELKLLRTKVGIIVLSAGVGNDIVGWVLLALCVALVNAGTGLSALYIVLVAAGYALFLFYVVRPAFVWYLRKTGSLQDGPSQTTVALTVLMVFASAFFTGIIGVHPIFGGFMIGLICPHDSGFAVKLTEKIEDLVSVVFLPVYFALSGLNTNIGLLDNGITWAYVIALLAVAFCGKIAGGTLAARLNGLVWRESFTIGTMMSCKGLVELIVLNIGLQAKILSTRTFTMFFIMAIVTTFATTPLVSWLYPHWYQVKLESWERGEIDWDTGEPLDHGEGGDGSVFSKRDKLEISRVLAYLRLDSLPGMLTLLSMMARATDYKEFRHPEKANREDDSYPSTRSVGDLKKPLRVHGMRLAALSDRDSSVMHVAELDDYASRDPVLNTITAFGSSKKLAVSGSMLLSPENSFSEAIVERSADVEAEMMVLPWSESGGMSEQLPESPTGARERFANGSFSRFIASAACRAACATAIFVDNGFGTKKTASTPALVRTVSALSDRTAAVPSLPSFKRGHHVFFPYYGSEDDRTSLRLVLQLARDESVTATIVHFKCSNPTPPTMPATEGAVYEAGTVALANTREKIEQGDAGTDSRGEAATPAPVPTAKDYETFFSTVRDTLPAELGSRVVFKTVVAATTDVASQAVQMASAETQDKSDNTGYLIVLGRGSSQTGSGSSQVLDGDARKALGDMADGMIAARINASLLVVRSASP